MDGPVRDRSRGWWGVAELDLEDIYARHRQGLFTLALSITRCAGYVRSPIKS